MRLQEDQQNHAGDALAPQGIAVALVSVGSLCCLVLVTLGMGLLKFRRQMRLGRFSQATAATSAKMDMAASMTNVPSQGVFRMWNISEEGPPDPPPRVTLPVKPRPVRPKTMEVSVAKPADKKVRPKSLDTTPVNEVGVDVVGVPSSSTPNEVNETSRQNSLDTSKPEVAVNLPSPSVPASKTKPKKVKPDKKSRPKSVDTSVTTPENGVSVTASKTKGKKEKADKKSRPKSTDTPVMTPEDGLPVTPSKTKGKKEKADKKSQLKSVDAAVTTPENDVSVTASKTKGKKEKADKKSRPKSVDAAVTTPEVPASKTKGKKEKTKAAPPSRRNPNAPAFARNSIITNVPTTPAQPPSPPATAMNNILIKTNPQANHNEVSNGSLLAPRSPVPAKTPKTKLAKSSKKNRPVSLPPLASSPRPVIVPQMSPVSQGPTSPVPIVTSPDFEETGMFTFQSRRDSPEPYDMPPSFLYGGVNDDEECDA